MSQRRKIDFTPWLCSWPDSSIQKQGFPRRFIQKWHSRYHAEPMLHLFCGGSMLGNDRVDWRKEARGATIIGSYDEVRLKRIYKSALADPPYRDEFAWEWRYPFAPSPSSILSVMADAVRPGGIIALLHLEVVKPILRIEPIAYHPVFSGTGRWLRCLNVFRVIV